MTYKLRIMNYEYLVLGVKHRLLSSIEKVKRLLGFRPQMEFKDGVKKVHGQTFKQKQSIYTNGRL